MTTRYVQFIWGNGHKWAVAHETPDSWKVYQGDEFTELLALPKVDYVLVEKKEAR